MLYEVGIVLIQLLISLLGWYYLQRRLLSSGTAHSGYEVTNSTLSVIQEVRHSLYFNSLFYEFIKQIFIELKKYLELITVIEQSSFLGVLEWFSILIVKAGTQICRGDKIS